MSKRKFFSTKMIVTLGLLMAMSIVLTRFLYWMPTQTIRISIGNLPIILAGIMFGPIAGAITGLLSDVLGTTLFSPYPWFAPLALTPVLMGLIPGFFSPLVMKKRNIVLIIVAILPAEIIGPMFWSTLSLHWLYGAPFLGLLPTRIPVAAGIAIFDIGVVFALNMSGFFRYVGSSANGGKNNELRGNAAIHPQREMAGK